MVKINKYASIAAILILVLCLGTVLVPAHKAQANGGITPVYVNVNTGSDGYDGSSPTYTGGITGPKQTIAAGFTAVTTGGTVNVAAGTYAVNITFNKSFTLAGAGAASTIINNGGASWSVIEVNAGVTVTISGVTIQHGYYTGSAGGLAVLSGSTVTVNDCVIKDNVGRNGGGVLAEGGSTLYMNGCTISGNSSPDLAPNDGGYGGGGISNVNSTANLTNCTISGNSASDDVYGYGGGILNGGSSATTTLLNCTVADNSASGSPGRGGGFYNASGCTITFKNTIVANNTATGGGNNGYNQGSGTVTSYGYNIDSEDSCGFTDISDQINTDPLLGPLQDNGGATPTCALLGVSPAVDAGTCSGAPTTDQRGATRPQGASCDIGAYELRVIPDVTGDYSIKGSVKFYDWKCNKWIVIKYGTLHITDQDMHKVKGYWEPDVALGWSDNVSVMGYVGPFFRDAKKGKIKNTPRLSLLLKLGTYCIYSDDTYATYILNGKVKMDKKTELVKSIKCTINGWGEFGGDDPTEAGAPNLGQFEGKFTAKPEL
jgi:hypothetical protein